MWNKKAIKIAISILLIPIIMVSLFFGSAIVVGVYQGLTGDVETVNEEVEIKQEENTEQQEKVIEEKQQQNEEVYTEEQYQTDILDLKNEIVELKNGNNDEYKKFTSADEVELSAGYIQ